jgi:hypothetical protein
MVKISDVLYFYRQQPESIMGKRYSLKRLDGLRALEERIAYLRDNFPKLENLAIKIYCFGATFHYQQIDKNPDLDPQYTQRKQIFKSIEKYHQWSVIKKWSWKDIVWYKLFIWTPKFYMHLRDYYEIKNRNLQVNASKE